MDSIERHEQDRRTNLFELMDAEDTPGILSVRASLLSEAGAVSGIFDGQVLLGQPLALVQSGDGLLRGGNQVLVILLVTIFGDLVKLLVELLELGSFGHGFPKHEEGRLVGLVAFAEEKFKTVIDKGKVEEQTIAGQTVASVTDNLDTTLGVVAVKAGEDFVVGKDILLFDSSALGSPVPDELILVFVVADGDRVVNVVADALGCLPEGTLLVLCLIFQLLLLLL